VKKEEEMKGVRKEKEALVPGFRPITVVIIDRAFPTLTLHVRCCQIIGKSIWLMGLFRPTKPCLMPDV